MKSLEICTLANGTNFSSYSINPSTLWSNIPHNFHKKSMKTGDIEFLPSDYCRRQFQR